MRSWLPAFVVLLSIAVPADAQVPTLFLPEQVHVTLGEEPGTLVVHWAVVGAPYADAESAHVVWNAGGQDQQTPAQHAGVITPGALNAQGASRYETHIYAATLGPFESGTKVTYRAGSQARGYTEEFTVALPPGPTDPFRFVAYGDIGLDATAVDGSRDPTATKHPAHEIQELALSKDPQLVVIPGDLSYSNSREGWDSFMRFFEPAASEVPVMPIMGNHEWDATLGYAQFLNEFVLPGGEENYVFRAGPVTFIAMNSDNICGNHARGIVGSPPRPCNDNEDGTLNLESTEWLEEALAEAENDSNPWTIVFHHHPALSYGRHNTDWAVHTYWMPLYERYHADVVITAHDHVYGRSYPTVARQPVMTGADYPKSTAPVYVVLGGGGRELYPVPEERGPSWHAHGESVHHFGSFQVTQDTLSFEAIRIDGSVMDAFTIGNITEETRVSSDVPAIEVVTLLVALTALSVIRRRLTR